MNTAVKYRVVIYTVLTCIACVLGSFAFKSYSRLMQTTTDIDDAKLGTTGTHTTSSSGHFSRIVFFGGAFFVTILGMGLMIGHDVSDLVGHKFGKLLFNDEGETIKKTGYELAEEVWVNGDHIAAIQQMREYLQENPKEQHVAIRIAEIYEKDLKNDLAAVLEYEEVLKQKLPDEQWGWCGIHLCNLYTRLGQRDKCNALLNRIADEYSATPAAEKARKRLELNEAENELQSSSASDAPQKPKPVVAPVIETPAFTLKKPVQNQKYSAASINNTDLQAELNKFHQSRSTENSDEASV